MSNFNSLTNLEVNFGASFNLWLHPTKWLVSFKWTIFVVLKHAFSYFSIQNRLVHLGRVNKMANMKLLLWSPQIKELCSSEHTNSNTSLWCALKRSPYVWLHPLILKEMTWFKASTCLNLKNGEYLSYDEKLKTKLIHFTFVYLKVCGSFRDFSEQYGIN